MKQADRTTACEKLITRALEHARRISGAYPVSLCAQLDREETMRLHRTCAKCGSCDVALHYRPALREHQDHGWRERNHTRRDEHMDHTCRSCGFEWEGDCLDACRFPDPGRVGCP